MNQEDIKQFENYRSLCPIKPSDLTEIRQDLEKHAKAYKDISGNDYYEILDALKVLNELNKDKIADAEAVNDGLQKLLVLHKELEKKMKAVDGKLNVPIATGAATRKINQNAELTVTPTIGKLFRYGNYYQSNDQIKEPIEWRVLDIQDGKALLLADKILDCQPYNKDFEETNWEKCSLNSWLNKEFRREAFSKSEWNRILDYKNLETPVKNTSFFRSIWGEPIEEEKESMKVFLLSFEEVRKYFSKNDKAPEKNGDWYKIGGMQASAEGTGYAKMVNGGSLYVAGNKNSRWWLRSVDSSGRFALRVNYGSAVYLRGNNVNDDDAGVRPALWISL